MPSRTVGRVSLWLLLSCLISGPVWSQSAPAPALFATDAVGRSVPAVTAVHTSRDDRYVGIFYFLWLNVDRVYDNTRILSEHPDALLSTKSPPWGRPMAYHFWGEPLYGYYRSEDPWVIRRHASLLADAGVDFLVFDATNAVTYDNVVERVCEVFQQQRSAGDRTPQLVFMVNTRAGATAQRIFERHYQPGKYDDLWFRWRGKPLLICDPQEASDQVKQYFTLRKAHWPFELVDTHNAWHWEATYPQVYSYDSDPARAEEVNVSVGQNLHWKSGRVEMMSTGRARGRSFHDGRQDDSPDAYLWGHNFQEQWERAHQLDPEIVFVTGWNEWIAMQLNREQGRPVFCDQFNLEFSRDVEMMKGGYGDNYYLQLAANIRGFKGMARPPANTRQHSIDIAGPFRQWEEVTATYRDSSLDTLARDYRGCGDRHYQVDSGRNDIQLLKVAHDAEKIYFYVRTRKDLSAPTDPRWMWLLLRTHAPGRPAWEQFQYLVNRAVQDDSQTSLHTCQGGWQWRPEGTLPYRASGRELQLAVPRAALGLDTLRVCAGVQVD